MNPPARLGQRLMAPLGAPVAYSVPHHALVAHDALYRLASSYRGKRCLHCPGQLR